MNTPQRQEQLRRYVSNLACEPQVARRFIDLGNTSLEDRIATTVYACNDQERDQCLSAHQKLLAGNALTPPEQFLYEAIVLPTERPALIIRDNSYERPPAPWLAMDEPAIRTRLERAIRSVARVEIVGPHSSPYAGTAFVVGPGLLMTNRHVAHQFSSGSGARVHFRQGLGSAVDFGREKGQSRGSTSYPVEKVVMCHPYWDMAILRVASLPVKSLTLSTLHPRDCVRRQIAVVGYPAQDPRGDQQVQRRIFGNDFGVKRFQPGFTVGPVEFRDNEHDRRRWRHVLEHDASTLGGNSGSAVIDVATGSVVGLHFAGRYSIANYAVPTFELARDGRIRDAGVQFTDGESDVPNPWQASWDKVDANDPFSPEQRLVQQPVPQESSTIDINIPIHISVQLNSRMN